MEETKTLLLVKENSILQFFKDAIVFEGKTRDSEWERGDPNPYYFFKDDIFIKKGFIQKERIMFELKDSGIGSRKKLVNRYVYRVEPYDDISDRMELVSFLVEPIE